MKIGKIGFLLTVLGLAGCGGGNGPTGGLLPSSRSIEWVTNWGSVGSDVLPSFSQSAVLTLKGASPDGTDFVVPYDTPDLRPFAQSLKSSTNPLVFTAHPQGTVSHILPLAPGTEVVQITSGADHLTYANGAMTGVTSGIATLTVTARGVTSQPTTITVTP